MIPGYGMLSFLWSFSDLNSGVVCRKADEHRQSVGLFQVLQV